MQIKCDTDLSLVLRVDFSNEDVWNKICRLITAPQEPLGIGAEVEFYSDYNFNNANAEQIIESLPKNREWWFLLIFDSFTISHSEHPLLCVDLRQEFGRTFRVIPEQVVWVESNLSILNMDFSDFYSSTDKDGIFRGFP